MKFIASLIGLFSLTMAAAGGRGRGREARSRAGG